MFSVEFKVNGNVVATLYGHNETGAAKSLYKYIYHELDAEKVESGELVFERSKGLRRLVKAILTKIG